jgi:ion channel
MEVDRLPCAERCLSGYAVLAEVGSGLPEPEQLGRIGGCDTVGALKIYAALRGFSPTDRYGLVIVLIGLAYVVTAATHGSSAQSVVVLVQLLTVWIVFTVSESPVARRITGIAALIGGLLTVIAWIAGSIKGDKDVTRVLFAVSAVLYLVAPVVIVRHIIRRNVVDGQTVLAAIAAYLLIGMMFAFVFLAVSAIQVTPPFFGAQGPGSASQDLFFSFVTLTTTGYGNLVPEANPGQSLAVLEAIVGQLFLVTAVAKVVTDWRRPSSVGSKKTRPNGD